MAVLFLDPFVLAGYAVLGSYIWLVWTGVYRSWFGQDAWWTLLVWPLPLVTAMLPIVAGAISAGLTAAGLSDQGGGTWAGAAYLVAYLVPWLWLSLAPPRRLLPPWARSRLAVLPTSPPATSAPIPTADAVPAINAWRGRGHAAKSRWVWAVDAAPGFVWVDQGLLCFRAAEEPAVGGGGTRVDEFDDDAVAQFGLHMGTDMHLVPPRGGWWARSRLDVDLHAVDEWSVGARRPGVREGMLHLEVAGRRALRLWVADVDVVRTAIAGARGSAPLV